MFGPPGALEQYYAALTDTPVASGQNGPADIDLMSGLPPSAGLVVRALAELLEARSLLSRSGCTVSLALQFIEIYNEQVRPQHLLPGIKRVRARGRIGV